MVVGSNSTVFRSVTTAEDRVPDAFGFAARTGVEPGSTSTSEAIVLRGFDAAASVVAGSGVAYSIDGRPFTTARGSLMPGQTLALRHTAGPAKLGYTKSSITVGGVVGTYTTRNR